MAEATYLELVRLADSLKPNDPRLETIQAEIDQARQALHETVVLDHRIPLDERDSSRLKRRPSMALEDRVARLVATGDIDLARELLGAAIEDEEARRIRRGWLSATARAHHLVRLNNSLGTA